MTFIPTFRHFRIYNIISLTGTAYSAVYLIVAATCESELHALSMLRQGAAAIAELQCMVEKKKEKTKPVGVIQEQFTNNPSFPLASVHEKHAFLARTGVVHSAPDLLLVVLSILHDSPLLVHTCNFTVCQERTIHRNHDRFSCFWGGKRYLCRSVC